VNRNCAPTAASRCTEFLPLFFAFHALDAESANEALDTTPKGPRKPSGRASLFSLQYSAAIFRGSIAIFDALIAGVRLIVMTIEIMQSRLLLNLCARLVTRNVALD